jgi:TolB-like protein/tetratricopeptide (TPR) repeat protein/tRNA A-37 threonylcarbamoyl transferase component Bud32
VAPTARACPACSNTLPPEAQFCMHCGRATPTDPGVPPRVATTGAFEVAKVTQALAGRYRIERVLGEGGMATVYLAEDLKHKRKVAVKVMRPELAATLGADRFLREVEIAARLSHPHVLPLYDSGESDGLLYYVMPNVEGETLRDRLARDGALPVEEALRYGREVADALAYAHARGVIHRDIKPANVLLSNGHALVADFGIARAIDSGGGEALTKTGLAVGTPQYMAPEQATGEKEVDGRADIYATGAILYEMLAGEPPFTGPNARAVLTRSLTETARPLTSVRTGLVPAFDAMIQKALAKSTADRYATADALATALDQVRLAMFASSSSMAAMTPAGTELMPKVEAPTARSAGRRLLNLRIAAIMGVAALAIWAVSATFMAARGGRPRAAGGASGNRVAVLPFDNQGASSDDYFAEGIADEVRGKLARVTGLSVTSSSTVDQFKSSGKSPQQYGQELGADYVLTGKVRWASDPGGGRRVQVVPELIDTRTGDVKWQQSFDTKLDDVFEVQSQIATRVAGALGIAIGGVEQQQLGRRPTDNVEAYQLYLRSRAITAPDVASLRQASGFLEQAVALDSTFAEAWAALSFTQSRIYSNGSPSPVVARRALEALDKARALAPDAALTHLAAARYLHVIGDDIDAARAVMEQALRAAPNDADVISSAGLLDRVAGDLGSSIAKLERAREIDPKGYTNLLNLAQTYTTLGRGPEGEDAATTALLVRPGDPNALQWLAMSRTIQGNLEGARAAVRSAIQSGIPAPSIAAHFAGYQETAWLLDERERQLVFRLTPAAFDGDVAFWGQSLATAYWQAGDKARARAYADSALAESAAQSRGAPKDAQLRSLYALMLAYVGRAAEARAQIDTSLSGRAATTGLNYYEVLNAARAELALGDRERAVTHLEQTRLLGSHLNATWLNLDPTWKSLKGNQRFERLLQEK